MLKLENSAKIAIIGAGPAGSFFANCAYHLAQKKGIGVEIIIFDGKNFLNPGITGCNMGAGVISETLLAKMADVEIVLPETKVQKHIAGYILHTDTTTFRLDHPEQKKNILTVFRGIGPLYCSTADNVSFDDFLLNHVTQHKIQIIPEAVQDIILPQHRREQLQLRFGKPDALKTISADLVVGAFGLNTRMFEIINQLGFGYIPPKTMVTAQAEIPLPAEYIAEIYQDYIYAFVIRCGDIRFGTIIPKKEYVTVSLIGYHDLDQKAIKEFLKHPVVKKYFPHDWNIPERYCFCRPRIAVTPSVHPFTDRLVLIGDTSFSRYYKNGFESAFDTAKLAAECAFDSGISATAFDQGYYTTAKRTIIKDNKYGNFLYRLNDIICHQPVLAKTTAQVVNRSNEGKDKVAETLRRLLWYLFTGTESYQQIFRSALTLKLQWRMFTETAKQGFTPRVVREFYSRTITASQYLGPLQDGQTVVIIGGGPAGVSAGITLKKIAKEKGFSIEVILHEGKVYAGEAHQNQCAGVLSPPIHDILERQLGIPFPQNLIQRNIEGYYLHSAHNVIKLEEKDGAPSVAVRRVKFDEYLLDQAKAAGVNVYHSRVTDLEFSEQKVQVYSESRSQVADVVIGAFGLDDGGIELFESTTPYHPPRIIHSIITKVHPGEEYVTTFEDYIHAFLPSLKKIEFGAVTPKQNHFTVNIAGAEVTAEWMTRFLALPQVMNILPPYFDIKHEDLDYFKGKIPISPAQGLFGDRYVLVGDAAGLVRPFKGKGINSGLITGILAAQTIMNDGISRTAFQKYYNACAEITNDLPYGKVLRQLAIQSANWGWLDAIIELAKQDARFRAFLFNCVSAHKPYKQIIRETWNIPLAYKLAKAIGFASLK
jgi:flavin-dependent dehydrogenase